MSIRIVSRKLVPIVLSIAFSAGLALSAPGSHAQSDAGPAPTAASIEAGRELFRANCVRCHGADATGTANGPNLLQRVKGMGDAAFSSAVLQRYRWSVPAGEVGGESGARDAMLRGLLTRRQTGDTMPAWESEPAVAKGVKSLFDFLSDRAR
jgi:mono/diheme cytochrome c family protein